MAMAKKSATQKASGNPFAKVKKAAPAKSKVMRAKSSGRKC